MSGVRCEADAFAGPAREGLRRRRRGSCWSACRLFDGPGVVEDHGGPAR